MVKCLNVATWHLSHSVLLIFFLYITRIGSDHTTNGQADIIHCFNNSTIICTLDWIHTQTLFSSLSHIRISVFEVLSVHPTDWYQTLFQERCRSMSWKKFNFDAHDTGFNWSSENALHECFIAEQWHEVWMEMLQLTAQCWKKKTLAEYEYSFIQH